MNDLVRHGAEPATGAEDHARPVRPIMADDGDEAEIAALLAALSSGDLGDATEEFDLTTLTPAERAALSRMLRARLEGGAAESGDEPA
jgi:hypothetical protein